MPPRLLCPCGSTLPFAPADWHVMLDRIHRLAAALAPLGEEANGAGAKCLFHIIAPDLMPRAVTTRQDELIAAAAPTYALLVDAMERQEQ